MNSDRSRRTTLWTTGIVFAVYVCVTGEAPAQQDSRPTYQPYATETAGEAATMLPDLSATSTPTAEGLVSQLGSWAEPNGLGNNRSDGRCTDGAQYGTGGTVDDHQFRADCHRIGTASTSHRNAVAALQSNHYVVGDILDGARNDPRLEAGL